MVTPYSREFNLRDAFDMPRQPTEFAVGHLQSLLFLSSRMQLQSDLEVTDPNERNGKVHIVAVIEKIQWGGRADDPIKIYGRFSLDNSGRARYSALRTLTERIQVEAHFVIYQCGDDFANKRPRCYPEFGCDGTLRFDLESLNVDVDGNRDFNIQLDKFILTFFAAASTEPRYLFYRTQDDPEYKQLAICTNESRARERCLFIRQLQESIKRRDWNSAYQQLKNTEEALKLCLLTDVRWPSPKSVAASFGWLLEEEHLFAALFDDLARENLQKAILTGKGDFKTLKRLIEELLAPASNLSSDARDIVKGFRNRIGQAQPDKH